MPDKTGLDERVNAGRNFINYEYADVNHGFHNDTTPRYDEAAAELAWQRTVQLFASQLQP